MDDESETFRLIGELSDENGVAIRRKEPNTEENELISSQFFSFAEKKQISLDVALKKMLESNKKTKRFAFQFFRFLCFLNLFAKRINRIAFSNERPPRGGTIGTQLVHD